MRLRFASFLRTCVCLHLLQKPLPLAHLVSSISRSLTRITWVPEGDQTTCLLFSADVTRFLNPSGVSTEHSFFILDLWVFTQGPALWSFSVTVGVLSLTLELRTLEGSLQRFLKATVS